MTDTPLTAEETWARANHETHSADCPVCAALTTRAEQAEANLREKLDELAATRDDLHEWQARVAELEAALKTTADALERLGIDVHDETRAAYALQFARAALKGKRWTRHYAPKAETSRTCASCGQDFTPPLLTKTVYPYGPGTRRYVVYFRSVRRTCGERCRRQLTSDSQPHRVYAA